MNNGMIRGTDVRVEAATRENGYVELTPEAAKNPWSLLGKPTTMFSLLRYDHMSYSQLPEDL